MALHVIAGSIVAAQWLFEAAGPGPRLLLVAAIAPLLRAAVAFAGLRPPAKSAVWAAALLAVVSAERTRQVSRPPEDPRHVVTLLDGAEQSPAAIGLRCRLVEPPAPRSRGIALAVECTEARLATIRPVHGRVALSIEHPRQAWQMGDTVEFTARLRRIRNFGNPGEFDWAGWNARRGVYVSAYAWDDAELLRGIAPAAGYGPEGLRNRLTAAIVGAEGAPDQARALVAAFVTGDRRYLSVETNEHMRASGLAHALSISGMHMSLVGGGILWLVIRLLRPTSIVRAGFDTARLAAPCAIVAVLGYAAISGGGVAVARSVLMSLLALGALAVGLRSGAGTGLSLAALALGLAEPGVANDAGFQLSFAAVAALLSQRQSLTVLGRLRPRPIAWMVSAFWLSLVAAGATAPLTAQHFHRVSWISPVANLAAAIPIAGAVALGLAAAVLHLFVPQAAALGFEGAAWSAHVVLRVAASAARLPFAESAVIAPGWPLVVCFSAFAASSALPEAGRRRVRVAIAIVSFGLVTAMWHERFRTDRLDVVFVSVGQGDATVVRLPGGRVLVVDAGLPGRGRLAVAPYLRRLHVGRVDYLVASHVQDDHWGGLPEVAEEFEIGEFWHPGGACEIPRFMDFTRALTDRGIDVIDVGALHGRGGILRRTGPEGWRIEAVWPTDAEGGCSANDRSIVLSIRYAGRTLVLTGDIEAATEHTLARVGGVSADLLKVPHHGSATSSTPEFLAAVAPAVAVASVGGNNRYGFPRPEVEARYRDAGASFFRTDRDGAVVATVGATCMTVRAAKRR